MKVISLNKFPILATKMRADYYLEWKEFTKALNLFQALSRWWRKLEKEEQQIEWLLMVGIWYRNLQKHQEACNVFKRILQKAWQMNNQDLELKVYDHLSFEHYYLGDNEKAKYYFLRFHRGWVETQDSTLRKQYIQMCKLLFSIFSLLDLI